MNKFARKADESVFHNKYSALFKILNKVIIERLADFYLSRIWQRFMTFGTLSAGFLTFLLIIHALKVFVDINLDGVALHKVYEFSVHLIGTVWSSVTYFLISLASPTVEPYSQVPKSSAPDEIELMKGGSCLKTKIKFPRKAA